MDALSAVPPERLKIPRPMTPSPRRIVFMKPTQIGGSEVGWNLTGYIIHHAPGPVLIVTSTLPTARKTSRTRLTPMIRECPELAARVNLTTKDAGNSTLEKEFDGGSVTLAGSNSAAGLKTAAIRYLIGDEVDEWPGDVEGQGDPVKLAEKRLSSYGRRAIAYYVSSGTIRDSSRIEKLLLVSDQRRYFVPCPACGHMDHMRWEHLIWEDGKPDTAKLRCLGCGELIDERWKTWMMDPANGAEWRSTAPEGSWDGETVGFHLNGLYMPIGWAPSWSQAVKEWLEAQGHPEKLKTFVNTFLAETYEERGEGAEPEEVLARRETYPPIMKGGQPVLDEDGHPVPCEVPNGVGYIVAAADVQGDRLELKIKGYGVAEESWLLAIQTFSGNPERDEVWQQLDEYSQMTLQHESGQLVYINRMVVDSNYLTDKVLRFCRARQHRKVAPCFPVRGGNEFKKPVIANSSVNKVHRVRVYTLCTETAKDIISKRLTIGRPPAGARAPGYMHFPEWIEKDYVDQLTAEKKLPAGTKGYRWTKIRPRNEHLDQEVYCLAALYLGGPALLKKIPELAARLARQVAGAEQLAVRAPEAAPKPPKPKPPSPFPRGGRGWLGKFRT